MRDADDAVSGRTLVVGLYVAVVALAGAMGYLVGSVAPRGLSPTLFGVVALPPTPVGTALYGLVTVATLLGVALALVVAVSRRTGASDG